MSDKTRTIFKIMTDLNYNIMVKGELNNHKFTDITKECYTCLNDYLRSGALGTTEKMKFILEHYGMDKSTVAEVWNMQHTDELTPNAIRIQEFRLNKTFSSIFGLPEIIENAFYNEDKEVLSEVSDKIRVLQKGDTTIQTYLTKEMLNDLLKNCVYNKQSHYTIDDCLKEVDFLVRLSKLNIINTAKVLDIDRGKLGFVLSVLNQPMIKKNNSGLNKDKYELVAQLHKNIVIDKTLETEKFLLQKGIDRNNKEVDYQQKYLDLLQEYKALKDTLEVQQQGAFDNTSNLVSNLFSEDITIPTVIMDTLNNMAKDYDGDKVLRLTDAKEFGDTLFGLTKYAIPIIVKDIASYDEKMLYCIWAALNNELQIENANETETQTMLEQFKQVMTDRVDILMDSDYVEQSKELLNNIIAEQKGDK